jgi:hypothetical protein
LIQQQMQSNPVKLLAVAQPQSQTEPPPEQLKQEQIQTRQTSNRIREQASSLEAEAVRA